MLPDLTEFKKIDAHCHVGAFGGWAAVEISEQKLIDTMDEYNIVKAVVSTYPIGRSLEAVAKYPDRLVGAAWVNPYDADAPAVARDAVCNHGFKAIKLHPLFHAFLANDEAVYPFAELAGELDVPLMIHSGHPPFSLPWSIAQLAELYPRVKMVMIHMGHGHGVYIQSAIDMAKKYDNLYLETSGMPMQTKIKEAYETVGFDRIMFGTDAPFHDHRVELLRSFVSGLDDEALQNLFYNNAAKLLKL